MNYCSNCGAPVTYCIPPGEDRKRFVCESCNIIHYQNPNIVVGCIPFWEDKVLLCRRAIEPRLGLWTLPAGYLENGETVSAGARRETFEEAKASMGSLTPYALYNLVFVNQVYLMFRGRLLDCNFGPGEESLDVRLFTRAEVPWDDLAFRVIRETLDAYFQDRDQGEFSFHMGNIEPDWITEAGKTGNYKS